ncbi:MAG TPA: hypothetical protein VE251_05250, partial [Xanthobacteraceae bacterium]|nr:hypothetical protein [Xanthobacteraceae bacterium]
CNTSILSFVRKDLKTSKFSEDRRKEQFEAQHSVRSVESRLVFGSADENEFSQLSFAFRDRFIRLSFLAKFPAQNAGVLLISRRAILTDG